MTEEQFTRIRAERRQVNALTTVAAVVLAGIVGLVLARQPDFALGLIVVWNLILQLIFLVADHIKRIVATDVVGGAADETGDAGSAAYVVAMTAGSTDAAITALRAAGHEVRCTSISAARVQVTVGIAGLVVIAVCAMVLIEQHAYVMATFFSAGVMAMSFCTLVMWKRIKIIGGGRAVGRTAV